MPNQRGQWGTKAGFILAAAGSAVGLGNLWKFPYITGENGGGLFVLIYLICIAFVGIPIMMAEIMVGRSAQKQPVVAFETIQKKKTAWTIVGWMGVCAGFVILSYYIVVAGWAMDYTLKSVTNFTGAIHENAEVTGKEYRATVALDEMRRMLVLREAEREWKDPIALAQRDVKPSAWDDYDLYSAGLVAANVSNPKEYNAIINTWEGQEDLYETIMGVPLPPAMTIDQTDAFRDVNAVLREGNQFANNIAKAELIFASIETIKQEHLIESYSKYTKLDDKHLRDEAEAVTRRSEIFSNVETAFVNLATDGWTATFWAAIFMLITILVVAGGVGAGIERTCKILMPTLLVLILVMVAFAATTTGFREAISFVFKPDPNKLQASGVLEALGHAFFTLSLGMGAMITYGSYQKSKGALVSQSITIAMLDTGIALLACLMIFPITFTYGQEPSAGPGLVFMSMPLAFAEIGRGGILLSVLFFGLLVFAAITSTVSLLEVVASYFIDKLHWTRKRAAWTFGSIIFGLSIPSAFAMDPNFVMHGWKASFDINFFDTLDYLASNWLLPLGGLFIAIYAGWAMPKKMRNAELEGTASILIMGWLVLIKFVAPIMIILVLAEKVKILDANEIFYSWFN